MAVLVLIVWTSNPSFAIPKQTESKYLRVLFLNHLTSFIFIFNTIFLFFYSRDCCLLVLRKDHSSNFGKNKTIDSRSVHISPVPDFQRPKHEERLSLCVVSALFDSLHGRHGHELCVHLASCSKAQNRDNGGCALAVLVCSSELLCHSQRRAHVGTANVGEAAWLAFARLESASDLPLNQSCHQSDHVNIAVPNDRFEHRAKLDLFDRLWVVCKKIGNTRNTTLLKHCCDCAFSIKINSCCRNLSLPPFF